MAGRDRPGGLNPGLDFGLDFDLNFDLDFDSLLVENFCLRWAGRLHADGRGDLRLRDGRQLGEMAFRLRQPGRIRHCAASRRAACLQLAQCEIRESWLGQNQIRLLQAWDEQSRLLEVQTETAWHPHEQAHVSLAANRDCRFQTALVDHRHETLACFQACPT
jgi:hypothetical protein